MTTATIMNASLNGMEKIQEMQRDIKIIRNKIIRIKPAIITIEPLIAHSGISGFLWTWILKRVRKY